MAPNSCICELVKFLLPTNIRPITTFFQLFYWATMSFEFSLQIVFLVATFLMWRLFSLPPPPYYLLGSFTETVQQGPGRVIGVDSCQPILDQDRDLSSPNGCPLEVGGLTTGV